MPNDCLKDPDKTAANCVNRGHNRPSSNERTVPESAPTANRMAVPFAHRFAKRRYTGLPIRLPNHSETVIMRGSATLMVAKMMWNASDIPICDRAAIKLFIFRACLVSMLLHEPEVFRTSENSLSKWRSVGVAPVINRALRLNVRSCMAHLIKTRTRL